MRISEKLKVSFTLQDALAVILKASGLKHDDYERYRDFCTRQIRLIRKNKRPEESAGKKPKKRATNKPVSSVKLPPGEKDLLLLLKCERAFAQAMVYRRDSAGEPRKVYHARKRWKKAEEIASRFVNQRRKHTREIKPFLSYQLMMKANRLFEYHRWGAAIKNFESSMYKDDLILRISSFIPHESRNLFKNHQNCGEIMTMRTQLMESLQRYCIHMKARAGDCSMSAEGEDETDIGLMEEMTTRAPPSGTAGSYDWFGFSEVNELPPKAITEIFASKAETPLSPSSEFWRLASSHMKSYYVLIRGYTHWKRRLDKLENQEINDFSHYSKGKRLALIRALGAKARLICKNISRFLSWNRNPEFVRDMMAMQDCLEHFAAFLPAVGKILRGKLSELPSNLPPPKDFRVSFLNEGPYMENSSRFYDRWQRPLRNIAAAFNKIPTGYEMTLCGPQPIRRHASFLETLGEFQLLKEPCQAIFAEENFAEIIPMKPVFYDLAYDMLDDPESTQ